jgi:hypothetical protein
VYQSTAPKNDALPQLCPNETAVLSFGHKADKEPEIIKFAGGIVLVPR